MLRSISCLGVCFCVGLLVPTASAGVVIHPSDAAPQVTTNHTSGTVVQGVGVVDLQGNGNGVANTAAPAVSEWGLVALGLIGLTIGTVIFARQHPVTLTP